MTDIIKDFVEHFHEKHAGTPLPKSFYEIRYEEYLKREAEKRRALMRFIKT
jgi:hypothetical protein